MIKIESELYKMLKLKEQEEIEEMIKTYESFYNIKIPKTKKNVISKNLMEEFEIQTPKNIEFINGIKDVLKEE